MNDEEQDEENNEKHVRLVQTIRKIGRLRIITGKLRLFRVRSESQTVEVLFIEAFIVQ